MSTISDTAQIVIQRWQSRAMRAEQALRNAGIATVPDMWSDDEYLVVTLQHKNGATATTSDLVAAQDRIAAKRAGQ